MVPQCTSSGRVGGGTQLGDPVAERPGRVLGLPVDRDPLDRPPFRRRPVRLAFAPAQRHDLVSGPHQARDEIGADVAGGSDDDDATHLASLGRVPPPRWAPHPGALWQLVGRMVVRGEFGLLERLRDLGATLVSVSIDP
jgi:hypothetical protein